ncbi:MAG: hypothetical protein IAF58_09595 [Leptolyngbya sp.]|nr:hypothetical protein [Candidatus Melainabacteria bacterium]
MHLNIGHGKKIAFFLVAVFLVSAVSTSAPAGAQTRMRIQRPNSAVSPSPDVSPHPQSPEDDAPQLTSSLPPSGLFAHWKKEFSNPTVCPIRLCHGSCSKTDMSCKSNAPMLQILLDAFLPEDNSDALPILNFRCCAGFSDDE